jgi:HD-GYP domain-containing protein (c-di-GMP phosphodiesterase class II)/DNA-binding CsgD family transcriptional regulator
MRLAEIIGALALAADLASGFALEKSLRTVLVASRLARLAGAAEDERSTVYWVSALRFVGCVGFAHEETAFAAGDDNSMRKTLVYADFDRPLDVIRRFARDVAPDATRLERTRGLFRFLLDSDGPRRYAASHCESGVFFARSVGLPESVALGLDTAEERFDGKGPRRKRGDELPFASRASDVADALELFWTSGGVELARTVLMQRRGRTLDPSLVDLALASLPDLIEGLDASSVWDQFLAAEPAPFRIDDEDIDRGCIAIGRFGDLKSVYTLAHSARVCRFAEAAGAAAGLSPDDRVLLRRAACLHDVGRVAVATGTWDKRGPLNAVEWQRVRAHSQHTEVVLRGAGLDQLADVAGATHERGRGAGYHRGLSFEGVPFVARLIAAADVLAALGEERPHRPTLDENRATKELRAMVEQGALDARAVDAVLDARGVRGGRKRAWPGGLTDREVEVVRLVSVGRTNKEIGALLGMSARTAQKHVMNVYDKLGLESRAGLALYAMEHGLVEPQDP